MKKDTIKLLAFGDCLMTQQFINARQFKKFINVINCYDFLTFNLETTVSDLKGSKQDKSFNFKTKFNNLKKFKEKVEIPILCNIANNHTFDYGYECFLDTMNNLKKLNIFYTGVSNNLNIVEGIECIYINDFKIAVIGAFNGNNVSDNRKGITPINNKLYLKVKYAKEKSDLVILHLHWGQELFLAQSPKQVKIAHKLVDYGADIILGHHPHVIQGSEIYKDSLIIYSLGNFQMILNEGIDNTNFGNMVQIEVSKSKKINYKLIPIYIGNNIPKVIEKTDNVLEKHNEISQINKFYLNKNSWIYFYCDGSEEFVKDNLKSWKIRKNKKENFLFLKFLRWFISKKTIIMFLMYIINKMFKVKEKVHGRWS